MRKFLITVLAFSFFGAVVCGQIPHPYNGNFPAYSFTPEEYLTLEGQNFKIVQGPDDRIYVANNGGLIFYDGVSWAWAKDTLNHKILDIQFNHSGQLLFIDKDAFGYLSKNHNGRFELIKTSDSLLKEGIIGRFIGISCIGEYSIYYSDKEYVIHHESWNYVKYFQGESIKSIIPLNQNEFIVIIDSRAIRHNINTDEQTEFDSDLKFKDVVRIRQSSDSSWVFIYEYGISELNKDLKVMNEYSIPEYANLNITDINKWQNGFIIGSDQGLYFLDNAHFFLLANTEKGLLNNYIRRMSFDKQGNLWLALDYGISVIDLQSPITTFSKKHGMSFTIDDIEIDSSKMLISTASGIYAWNTRENQFQKINGLEGECWAISNTGNKDQYLVGGNENLSLLNVNAVKVLKERKSLSIHQSRNDPNRIWVGTDRGFISLYNADGNIEIELEYDQIGKEVWDIGTDAKGNVWFCVANHGVYQLKDEKTAPDLIKETLVFFNEENGLPIDDPRTFMFNAELYFATTHGIFEFDNKSANFELSDKFTGFSETDSNYFFRTVAVKNKIWSIVYNWDSDVFHNGWIDIDNKKSQFTAFKRLPNEPAYALKYDQFADNLWLGSQNGTLYCMRNNGNEYLNYEFPTFIGSLKMGGEKSFFNIDHLNDNAEISYEFSKKPLVFEFGSASYKNKEGQQYQYRLIGFDSDWSEWTTKTEVPYTNIPGGKYTFQVRSKDYFDIQGKLAEISFRIFPPWYQTWWAYIMYGVIFIGFIFGTIKISNRGLRHIIELNTREIRIQKEKLEDQNKIIGQKNQQITDSIRYAKRIQMATLPAEHKIKKSVENAWVMYRPKDIVSGDFYWLENFKDEKAEKTLIAAVDCTGHGVPGAFMSIIGYNGLNRVVREYRLNRPSEVLDRLNEIITTTLNQQGAQREEIKDGMDMSLCSLDRKNLKLEYAGAHNSLYIIRKGDLKLTVNGNDSTPVMSENDYKLFEIKADKQPIGAFENRRNFKNYEIQLNKNDMIILFTDGYADQFGGPKGKKFFYKPFKKMLLSIADMEINKQQEIIENTFDHWISHPDAKGNAHEQIDDICVMVVKV